MAKPKTFKNWVLKSPRFTIDEPGVYSFEFVGRWTRRKWADRDIESRESTSMEGEEG